MVLPKNLLRNIRFLILISSSILAVGIKLFVNETVSTETAQIIELTQLYALTGIIFLYFTMLAFPLTLFFSALPFKETYLKSRRALSASAFLFALLHSYFAFFGELGGFAGLQFLNTNYLATVTLGATSLTILGLLTFISFERVLSRISRKKIYLLQKLVYLAALFIVIHALMLGSHFADFSKTIPQIFSLALAFLLMLEAIRFDLYLYKKFAFLPKAGISFFLISLLILILLSLNILPSGLSPNISLHEAHKKLAQEVQSDLPAYLKNLPGMQGDKTKRFTVDADFPDNIIPNQPAILKFRVFDASNGAPVNFFTVNYGKLIHLIIVDSSLNSYQHIHPELKNGWFEIPVTFPKEDRYHLYLDFVPTGAIEQQFAFTLNAGNPQNFEKPNQVPDGNLSKRFGDYKVTLKFDSPLKAGLLSIGGQNIDFEISDRNNNPVTTLKPYLGSFGHMVMLNTQTFEYLHVHPFLQGSLQTDQNGGPEVSFMPVGIYGPIKAGTYKMFAQFNPDNNLITTDFIVKVQ